MRMYWTKEVFFTLAKRAEIASQVSQSRSRSVYLDALQDAVECFSELL